MTVLARERIPVNGDLLQSVTARLDCYAGYDADCPSTRTARQQNYLLPTNSP